MDRLELQTLGTVGVRRCGAGDSVAETVQPKRLALLVYLAMAPRRRCRRPDQVIAFFWPEFDTVRARASLNRSLHALRQGLGKDVLISQGEEEVGVDGERLSCDAVAFDTAMETANAERALQIYKGAFLDGFHVSDTAAEYDRWVGEQRDRFRTRASSAALSLSQGAETRGDLARALWWARRGAEIAPDDESLTASLIRLLDLSGDRVSAFRT